MGVCGRRLPRIARTERLHHSGASGRWPHGEKRGSQDPGDCVGLVMKAIGREGLGTGTCVILDDLGVPNGPDAFAGVEQLGKALWRMGARLVLTTRSKMRPWPAIARSEWAFVDETDLSLNLRRGLGTCGTRESGTCRRRD